MHSGFPVLVIGLFLLGFLKAKACVVAKHMVCFALEFFSLGTRTLQNELNLHNCYMYLCFHGPVYGQSFSCVGLVVFALYSCVAFVSAWLEISSSCTRHLILLYTGDTLD